MAFKMDKKDRAERRRQWEKTRWGKPNGTTHEEPKDHENIPDLHIGVFEKRQEDGALMVFFMGTHLTIKSAHVVIGKFRVPSDRGEYYVSDYSAGNDWTTPNEVTYHEHIFMAIAKVYELKDKFHERTGHVYPQD